ncbi:MAG TPA: tetratricopeptide repeat protein [Candidatus Acidoferrum sp.]|nr:tetratricopeptide repeat protein [Candidatus Acidoferrum sp.]
MAARLNRFTLRLLLFAAAGFLYVPLASSHQANQQMKSPERPCTLVVSVRSPDGSPLDTPAIVNLFTFSGSSAGIGVFRAGTAEFANLSPASYTLEIIAAGYQRLKENVQLMSSGERQHLSIFLTPESVPSAASPPSGSPILAPNAEKEVTKALEDLRANKPEDARKHLEKASRAAPAHPDISYLWGMYYAQLKDYEKAKVYWEKAVQIAPRHVFSLAALAQLALQSSDYPTATGYLLRASEAAPSVWRYHERLAETYLNQRQYEEAGKHAQRALELGKERAAGVQFVLAQTFLHSNNSQAAIKALAAFLTAQPSGPRAVEAQKLLDKLQKPELTALAPAASTPTPANSSRPTAPSLVADLMPPPKWMPPDVDDSMPAVESTAGCPLQNIQEEAGKRVSDFVDAVNRIAATESLENEVIDRSGLPVRRASRNYSYVASVQQVRPGMYTMEEYRNGMMDLDQFPERIATLGLTALVMVFHPVYVGDYDLACEGLSRWHGSLAWQVHFRQKGDKPARLRSYRVNSMSFPISLRGRAWIAADTFQIVSLETDLVAPVPQIQLRAEHIAVEYMPVKFVSHHQQLWLPESAEIYFDYASRRMHRRHHFRDYMLFAVDERQQISVPKVESDTGSTDPRQN